MAQGLRALGVALLLAGCGPAGTDVATQAAGTEAGAGAGPLLARELLIREETPELDFSATLAPEMALAPTLATEIRRDALAYRNTMQTQAAADMKDAEANGFPARPYGVLQEWTTEAETPALLAFRGLLWEYTGGAHGNSTYTVALYDRANKRRIATEELFTDPKAAQAVLQPLWCKGLDAARREKLGSDFEAGDCPLLADLPIVPTGRGAVGQLKILAAPYVAGSYAEGTYEVLVETAAILPLLKPEWRATFGATDSPGG